jgi:hypothetical protein
MIASDLAVRTSRGSSREISVIEDGRFFYVTDEDEGVHLRLIGS